MNECPINIVHSAAGKAYYCLCLPVYGGLRAPPKRPKTVVLAKMQKMYHLKQISELNITVGVIFY